MNRLTSLLPFLLLPAFLPAQIVSIFPDEYAAVPEGPFNAPNIPLAGGTSRVLILYDRTDIAIASGRQITKLGFRQDATLTTIDVGRTVLLEIRMGYSTATPANLTTNFANTYAGSPVTVFPQANFVLPNLRDITAPLTNGQFFITLTTPFTYNPAPGENLVVEYLIYGNSGGGTTFNYRLDRADFYSPTLQGPAGCPRSGGGLPALTVAGVRPGQSYSTSLATGPGNSFAVLMIAPGSQLAAPFSLQPFVAGINAACMGQVPLGMFGTLTGLTSGTGAASWSFLIPNNPALYSDMYVASQCAIFDTFAPGGLVVSNGAQVRFGALPRTSVINGAGPPATTLTGTVTRNYCPVAFFEHQ